MNENTVKVVIRQSQYCIVVKCLGRAILYVASTAKNLDVRTVQSLQAFEKREQVKDGGVPAKRKMFDDYGHRLCLRNDGEHLRLDHTMAAQTFGGWSIDNENLNSGGRLEMQIFRSDHNQHNAEVPGQCRCNNQHSGQMAHSYIDFAD